MAKRGETWRGGFVIFGDVLRAGLKALAGTAEQVLRERLADPRFQRVELLAPLPVMSEALAGAG